MKLEYTPKTSTKHFSSLEDLIRLIQEKQGSCAFIAFKYGSCPLFITVTRAGKLHCVMRSDCVGNTRSSISFETLVSDWTIHMFDTTDHR